MQNRDVPTVLGPASPEGHHFNAPDRTKTTEISLLEERTALKDNPSSGLGTMSVSAVQTTDDHNRRSAHALSYRPSTVYPHDRQAVGVPLPSLGAARCRWT